MPKALINGTELHYEIQGDQGPPVLLIMGMRARGLAWEPIVEKLAADKHCEASKVIEIMQAENISKRLDC